LGCRANQFDSESLFAQFAQNGYQRAEEFTEADVHIVNTCTVTNTGDAKGRNLIRKVMKSNPNSRVVVTGCSAQQDGKVLLDLGVDLVVDNANKNDLYRRYQELLSIESTEEHIGERVQASWIHSPIRTLKTLEYTPIESFGNKTRAHLKIQDGCNQYCTYCIIPHVRGRSRSLEPERIFSQLNTLLEKGYKEIVLTGIHVGHYQYPENVGDKQRGKGDKNFAQILKDILDYPGDFRVRLSSIEPLEITKEVLKLFEEYPHKLCRSLHIAIQSGSSTVLERMKRRYSRSTLESLFEQLFAIDSHFGFGIDVIVGFPGETEEEFQESCSFIQKYPLSYGHVFPFSAKKGTPAAGYPEHVSSALKKERGQILRSLIQENQKAFLRGLEGSTHSAIFENSHTGTLSNFVRVRLSKNSAVEPIVGREYPVILSNRFTQQEQEKYPVVECYLA
jgi:threonylcarbamoyladenosine tRNA methylthiotransferase MtaB